MSRSILLCLVDFERERDCCPCTRSLWADSSLLVTICSGLISGFNDMIALMCGDARPGLAAQSVAGSCTVSLAFSYQPLWTECVDAELE